MVDLNSSQIVLKRFHLQQAHQHTDLREFTSRIFNYTPVGYKTSHVNPHSFIVDWEIPESVEDEKKHELLPT
jgi:hypothetical protein